MPITSEAIISGSLDLPGQRDRFRFDFEPGDRLLIDSLQPGGSLFAGLEDSSGWIHRSFDAGFDSPPFYPAALGTDRLVLYAWGAETSDYRFRVLNLTEAEELPLGVAVFGLLDPPNMTQAYRFIANAGQRLKFEGLGASQPHAGWSLLGSSEHFLQTTLIRSDLSEITLPASGTYWVLVQGWPTGTEPLEYQIRVSVASDPSGVASGFNEVHTVNLQSGVTNYFSYTAPAGTRVYLDHLGGDASWLWADLRGPDGAAVFSIWALEDYGPVTLPFSGNYTLELRASGGMSPGNYKFRLLDMGSSAVPLEYGVVIDGPIEPAGATDVYRFDGAPGQSVFVDALGTAPESIRVIGPSGQEAPGWFQLDNDILVTLAEPGSHHLLVRNTAGTTAEYQFRFLDPGLAPAVLLLQDTPVNGWLTEGWQADLFRLNVHAGQRLFFDVPDSTTDILWTLFSPQGQFYGYELRDFEVTPDWSGAYTLVVSSRVGSPIGYDFEVVTAQSNTMSLELGTLTAGTLATRGEQAVFTFTGDVGQRLFFDAIDSEIAELETRLIGPDGGYVFYDWNLATDHGPFTLTLEGVYRLIVGGNTSQTGRFRFRLIDLDGPPVIPLVFNQGIVDAFDPPGAAVIYSFQGIAGQRLFIDSQDPDAVGGWTLYPTEDFAHASLALSQDSEVILPRTGTYLLVLSNWSSSPNSYALVVRTPETVSVSVELGGVTHGSIALPGEEHHYTFEGVPGMQVYYDALDVGVDNLTLRILDPANATILEFAASSDYGPIRLTQAGTYTAVLGGMNDSIGDYQFRLLDLSAALDLPSDLRGELDPPCETDLLRFDGAAGQRVVLELRSTSNSEANWRLIAPSGVVLAQDSSRYALVVDRLAEDGVYHVLIEGSGGAERLDYQIFRTTTSPFGTPSGFGELHSGSIAFAETHVFHYIAPAGLLVYFDSQIGSESSAGLEPPLEMDFRSAAGNVVIQGTPSRDAGPLRLPDSGEYTLAIRGQNPSATGDYRFRLVDMAADAVPIVMGENLSAAPDPFGTRVFKFTGAAGQQLFYDALSGTWSSDVTQRGFDPAGNVFLGPEVIAEMDHGPFALLHSGDHYVMLRNNSAEVVEVRFRLVDLSRPPTQPLALGESKTDALDPGFMTHFYRVPVPGRSRLVFDGSSDNGNASWTFYSPNLDLVHYGSATSDAKFDVSLQGGDYLLIINGFTAPNPVDYTIGLHPSITVTSEIELGASVSGVLAGAESEHRYTFYGSSGQTLYYDALEGDFEPANVFLIGPHGQTLIAGHPDSDYGPVRLIESGTYTLIQENLGFETTGYSFCLIDCATQPSADADVVIEASLQGFQAHIYKVEPAAGLGLFFDLITTDYPTVWWSFHSPRGEQLAGDYLHHGLSAVPAYPGTYWLAINSRSQAVERYAFRMVPGNHTPMLSAIDDLDVDEENAIEFTVVAEDVESPNDLLTFTLDAGAPSGALLDPVTGEFRWTPAEDQGPGEHVFTVRVTDDGVPSLASTQTFTIRVREINRAPMLAPIADRTIHAGGGLRFPIQATDPDIPANTLSFAVLDGPPGGGIDATNGVFTWNSMSADTGMTFPIEVEVTDNGSPALSATVTFAVTVTDPLQIVSIESNESGFELSWFGIAGHGYLVQYRDHLDAAWLDLGPEITGAGSVVTATDAVVAAERARYYRVVDVP